jgi:hypothetical protein
MGLASRCSPWHEVASQSSPDSKRRAVVKASYVFPDSAISVDLLTEGKRQTALRSSGDLVFDKVAAVWGQDSRVFEVRIADSISESQTFFAFHTLEKGQINPSTLKH